MEILLSSVILLGDLAGVELDYECSNSHRNYAIMDGVLWGETARAFF